MTKPRKCKAKSCGEYFTPQYSSIQLVCSPKCALEYNKNKQEEKESKEWAVEKKKIEASLKSRGDYENELQTEINLICRLIDQGCTCISCSKVGKMSAGHYHSRGKNTTLRFNLHNLNIQCFSCNGPMSANIINYNKGLRERYGNEYQKYVEIDLPLEYPLLKWSINDLILWKALAVTFRKELTKKADEGIRSPEERLRLKTHYNNKIGIYIQN